MKAGPDHPVLSICVATVNRDMFLSQTLNSILSQATPEVEVVIVDGGSTDSTPDLIASLQTAWPQLHYIRLHQKGGVDQDYARAVAEANGTYCWLMTDDDLLLPGAVSSVVEATRRGVDLVIVNAEVRTADLRDRVEQSRLHFRRDRPYRTEDLDRLFQDVVRYLSFIGSVVIRRDVWNERIKEKYFGSLFIHVGVIFQRPLQGGAFVMADPKITIRYGNAQWAPRSFEIWSVLWPRLLWSFDAVGEQAKDKIEPRSLWGRLRKLLLFRAQGTYGLAEYRKYRDAIVPPGLLGKPLALGIALMPGVMLNLLALAYYAAFRRTEGVQIADLRASPHYLPGWLARRRPGRGP